MGQVSDGHDGGHDGTAPPPSWMSAVRRAVENNLGEPETNQEDPASDKAAATEEHEAASVRASDVKRLRVPRTNRVPTRPATPSHDLTRPLRLRR